MAMTTITKHKLIAPRHGSLRSYIGNSVAFNLATGYMKKVEKDLLFINVRDAL